MSWNGPGWPTSRAVTESQGGVKLRILGQPGITPLEGGVPIVVDGKVIGAIGVSGVLSNQDAEVAMAGAAAVAGK